MSANTGCGIPSHLIHSLTLTPQKAAVFSKIDPAIVNDGMGGNDGQFFYIVSYEPLVFTHKYAYLLDFPGLIVIIALIYPLLAHITALVVIPG